MFSAAILAGGASRRMGRPKALIEVEGSTLVERTWNVLDRLRPLITEVFVVGVRPEYVDLGLHSVPDERPGSGPLGGIATALRHAAEERTLVVACDMPHLSTRLLDAMLLAAGDEDVLVPDSGAVGCLQLEPLHAIYRRSCLAAIDSCLARGVLKTTAFYHDVRVRRLDDEWVRRYDPELASFVNVNTPDELRAALEAER
jgi:molybdopterin-guanine dinucleotide biosynthesis protein A